MSTTNPIQPDDDDAQVHAEFYDRSINWPARLHREISVLVDVFGPPGDGGILDAGCGTGRQAIALAERGYRTVGADISDAMLTVAGRNARTLSRPVNFVLSPFATLYEKTGGGFDGVYCLGNSLAAAGTRDAAEKAVHQFALCLRPGGRLFIQVVNFHRMRSEHPCVRGPRVTTVDGVEYVSVRLFHFVGDAVEVSNITLWREGDWKCRTHAKMLFPVTIGHLESWCKASGLRIDDTWGGYAREPYAPDDSMDLLIAATRG